LSGAPSTSAATAFITLKPWNERDISSFEVVRGIMGLGMGIPQGQILAFNTPPIMGLSTTGGFTGDSQSTEGASYEAMHDNVMKVVEAANKRPELEQVRTARDTNVPRYHIDVDRDKVKQL